MTDTLGLLLVVVVLEASVQDRGATHTQLRLARPLVADLRRPWERPSLRTG